MNQQQAQRLTTMSEIIRPLFTSLPLPRGLDHDELLSGYLVALEGTFPSALKAVVIHLVKGTWHEEVKFCPRPPELANMVRFEQRRVEAINRPRISGPVVVPTPFKDLRVEQRLRADELATAGYVKVADGITHEEFASMAKSRAIPSGSRHLWALDEVWAPKSVSHLVDANRIAARKAVDAEKSEPMTAEQAEYWSKINGLRDAAEVTEEQMAHRRKIASDLDALADEAKDDRSAA